MIDNHDIAKLVDFGMARRFQSDHSGEEEAQSPVQPKCFGKPRFVAPEVRTRIAGCPHAMLIPVALQVFWGQPFHATKADIYSLGMVLLVSFLRMFPYSRPDPQEIRFLELYSGRLGKQLTRWNAFGMVPHDALCLLEAMLCPPEYRCDINTVMNHPFVAGAVPFTEEG